MRNISCVFLLASLLVTSGCASVPSPPEQQVASTAVCADDVVSLEACVESRVVERLEDRLDLARNRSLWPYAEVLLIADADGSVSSAVLTHKYRGYSVHPLSYEEPLVYSVSTSLTPFFRDAEPLTPLARITDGETGKVFYEMNVVILFGSVHLRNGIRQIAYRQLARASEM